MKKSIIFCLFFGLLLFNGFTKAETNQNAFVSALKNCDKYSNTGIIPRAGNNYTLTITLEKTRSNCQYKEKISLGSGYQLLTCHFDNAQLQTIADYMDKYNNKYKKDISKNSIYEAKLTNSREIFENFLINPDYCKITNSVKKKK